MVERAGRRVTSPREKGQRDGRVHHSEVSEPLFTKADEAEQKGGENEGGVTEKWGIMVRSIFVWFLVDSLDLVTQGWLVGHHQWLISQYFY